MNVVSPMHIFLTGGTGYVGAAVLDALVRAGHRVDALVRNSERAARVQARGARAVIGDLSEPPTYAESAALADGAIHTAFEYSPRGAAIDGTAVDALLRPVAGRDRFFIYTSGIWVLGNQQAAADEAAALDPPPIVSWRPAHEQRVLAAAASGLRTAVVRPGIVYGASRGFVCDLLKDAANGLVRVIGPGNNHWPLVYDRDLGELYLRLATTAAASGIFHANDEGDERVNDIVAAIAGHVPVKPSVRRIPLPEARKKLGPVADALALDQVVRSPRARAIGWNPSLHSVAGNAARLFEEWRRGKDAA
jgi:nucleoside-diphosphate-sugar epimerase